MHWNKPVWSVFLHFIWFHENSRQRRLKNHEKVALTALYTSVDAILFFAILTSFFGYFWRHYTRNEMTLTSTKIKTKCLFRGSLALSFDVTLTIYVPSWGFLSKHHVQTASESHDSNMVLIVWKRLLVDLTMASKSCVHKIFMQEYSFPSHQLFVVTEDCFTGIRYCRYRSLIAPPKYSLTVTLSRVATT